MCMMSSSVTSSLPWLIKCAPSSLNMCFYHVLGWWMMSRKAKQTELHGLKTRSNWFKWFDLCPWPPCSGSLWDSSYYWLDVSTLNVWIWVCATRALTWEISRFVLKPWLYIIPNDLYLLRCISYSQLKIFVQLLSAIALGILYNLAYIW